MTEESNPRFLREVDARTEPMETARNLRLLLERKTAEVDELRARMRAVEHRLGEERHAGREARNALDALRDERNLLAVHLHGERLTVEELQAERSEVTAKIKALEQELRLAWRKVDTLEELLRWERQPLHRRAFRRRSPEE
jgi:chromosome segregation ATPase